MKKVELLAPAGNFEALTGAVNAGADAVYLGGEKFGARAYADNFTCEELCRGIDLAHLFGVKIYLAVNTLVKEREFDSLYEFLLPLYEAGLDAAIVQDFGVFAFIREHFPGLSLHISTQMTVTGAGGAALMKAHGAMRIVPARELSIEEIRQIKNQVDIELEAFVHGAMCYCYSGQCLFSSILGGRSGNRGRCAQPCRLPYQIDHGRASYPLSMKDMCTLSVLPELIEAGIDSFKIEGRMKKPEYAAGVAAVYRRYIDAYYENPGNYHVRKEDLDYLKSLYIREGVGEGYYHVPNGKEMLTSDSPAYAGSNQKLLKRIRETYIERKPVIKVTAKAVFRVGEPALMTLAAGEVSVSVRGDVVSKAQKQPLTTANIEKQLLKCGNSSFEIEEHEIQAQENIFLPVSSLNSLRREALKALQEKMLFYNGFHRDNKALPYIGKEGKMISADKGGYGQDIAFHVLVSTKEQLAAAVKQNVSRIYIDRYGTEDLEETYLWECKEKGDFELFLVFPYIVRAKDFERMEELYTAYISPLFNGALVRNLETLSFLADRKPGKALVADANMYVWNRKAHGFLKQYVQECCLPVELNRHEWEDMTQWEDGFSVLVYGRLPLMITANCLRKTSGNCVGRQGYSVLTDRYHKEFPVYSDCDYCYNVIYNSVPLSLHGMFAGRMAAGICRLDFTVETGQETGRILGYFERLRENNEEPFSGEYTTGHYKRGVE